MNESADNNEPTNGPVGASAAAPAARVLGRMGRLVRKEVATILRDRRTIITLVLMPLLLYPLLSIAFRQFLLATDIDKKGVPDYVMGFARREEARAFVQQFEAGQRALEDERPSGREDPEAEKRLNAYPHPLTDLEGAVRKGLIDLGVRVRIAEGESLDGGRKFAFDCELLYLPDSPRAREAVAYVERRLAAVQRRTLLARRIIVERPPPVVVLRPQRVAVEKSEQKGAIPVRLLIPLVLILMTITGAVYPAIDLTAGERERGTLEVLVAAPIPRLGLLFAKYVSVVIVAVLTAVVNLVTMTVTVMLSGLAPLVFGSEGPPLLTVVQVFFLLLLFAAFFSALLLTVTSFARSFKEAQAYLIPLMLVSLTPGMMSLLPELKLEGPLLVAPLVNIVLLARDILEGTARLPVASVVVLTTVLYALAAVALAARVFGAEAVLYNEQAGWGDLFRRPARPRPAPSVSGALLCLALLFPISYVLHGLLARYGPGELGARLAWMTGTFLLLFGLIPLVSAWLGKVRGKQGFGLERAGLAAWGPCLLLGLSLWPLAEVLRSLLERAELTTLGGEHMKRFGAVFAQLRTVPAVVVILCLAVPAVLEELFFRGYLFGALARAWPARSAVLGSALFFGLFHLLDRELLIVERFVISTVLGVLLGWLRWKTGSVLPGMVLHATHNSLLVLFAYYQGQLPDWIKQRPPSLPLLGATALGILVAAAWLALVLRRPPESFEGVKDE